MGNSLGMLCRISWISFNCLELLEFVGICGIRASPSLPVMERAAASSPTHLLPLSFNHRRRHHHHHNHHIIIIEVIILIIIGVFNDIIILYAGRFPCDALDIGR